MRCKCKPIQPTSEKLVIRTIDVPYHPYVALLSAGRLQMGIVDATCIHFGSGEEFHRRGGEFPQIYGSYVIC
jgi:hypothetical protein